MSTISHTMVIITILDYWGHFILSKYNTQIRNTALTSLSTSPTLVSACL